MRKERQKLHLSSPLIHPDAEEIVLNVLKSGWVSSVGEAVSFFEEDISDFLGCDFCFATNSGTSALHLAMLSLGIGKDDLVIVPDITFIAPVNAAKYCSADVVFIDCDSDLNMSSVFLEKFIRKRCNAKNGKLFFNGKQVKAVVVVHILGNPANIEKIVEICRENRLFLIEDTTEGLGSKLDGRYLGLFGDVGILSFNGNKIITTGAGGALVTNNRKLYEKAKYLGMQAKDDSLYYIHNEIGYNYRMSAIQAALGISQLRHLNEHIEKKKKIYSWYKKRVSKLGVKMISPLRGESIFWLSAIRLSSKLEEDIVCVRDKVIEALIKRQIFARPLWVPNHLQKPYKSCEYIGRGSSIEFWNSVICLPSDLTMDEEDVEWVVENLMEILN